MNIPCHFGSGLPDTLPLLISGRDDVALQAQADRWAAWIQEHPDTSWADFRHSAALRPQLTSRATIQAPNTTVALDALNALAAGRTHPGLSTDHAQVRTGLVFVFAGLGGQWNGMGRQLLEESPIFAETVAQCDDALFPHIGWSVDKALRGKSEVRLSLDRFDVVQALSFTMGIGLAAVYRQLGIMPAAIVGHSLGEMTAAVAAGAISLEEGAAGICTCARLIVESSHQGGMVFIKLSATEVEALIRPFEGLFVGTVDGPDSTVVSGGVAELVLLEKHLSERGVFHRRVKVPGAPHTPHMEPLASRLYEAVRNIRRKSTQVPIVSSITGEQIESTQLDAAYWVRNLCSQVRFDKAVRTLMSMGMTSFLEIGPHPMFTTSIASICAGEGLANIQAVGSMHRNDGGLRNVFATLGALHNSGHSVPWSAIFGQTSGELPALPNYVLPQEMEGLDESIVEETNVPVEKIAPIDPEENLAALPMEARIARITATVREEMVKVLGLAGPEAIDANAALGAQGLDSLKILDLKNRVSKRVGLRLPQQFLYEYPTLEQATRAIAEQIAPSRKSSPSIPPPRASKPNGKLADILPRETSMSARIQMVLGPLQAQVAKALGRDEIDAHRSLQDMGIDDVLGAELCLRIQRETGLRVFPREIVEQGTLHDLAKHVASIYAPYRSPNASVSLDKLDQQIASPYHDWPMSDEEGVSEQKLTFILSPPRSGSTLLRVMLAGHSGLFSPQELYLAPFRTMRDYDDFLQGTVLNMGLVGTIAEVISRTGSWNLYRQWVREEKPTAEIYEFFRERIGGRILVDKSPLFFPPLAVLRRLARHYPNARFIHLIRHPISCIGSYIQERFQGIFKETATVDPYDAAEWCWTRVNEGIATFASEIPANRMVQVYFEDLAEDPERVMRRLCPALGLPYEPAVLEPYSGHRMVAGGFQIGDPNFTRHKKIVADKSEAWRKVVLPRALQAPTLVVAERLGYDVAALRSETTRSLPRPPTNDTGAMGGIGMERDIHLPAEIVPRNAHVPSSQAPRSVLLTGATGFLGAFLLDELLRQTDARVHCLVRAKDADHALNRVRENLSGYQVWKDEYAARIVPVLGDMGLPGMGVSDEARQDLASRIDAIYHCAARVSWLLPYSHLRDTNVGGLVQILRLACTGRTLPVHYVSSLGTAFTRPFDNRDMVDWVTRNSGLGTESILELPLGYLESKWVNMHIVAQARERGIPVSLYAPGLIGGHSQSGVDSLSESQFLHALIKGSTQLGGFPDAEGWRFIPVDQTAKRVIACSLRPESRDVDLYLDSTRLIDPQTMVDVLRSYRYEVKLIPFAVWRQKVLDLADQNDTTNALFGFTDVIYSFTPLRFQGQRLQMNWFLQNRNVEPSIREIVGEQAYVNRELLERLVGYYVRVGAMP